MELIENYIQPLVFLEFEKIIKLNKKKISICNTNNKKKYFFLKIIKYYTLDRNTKLEKKEFLKEIIMELK